MAKSSKSPGEGGFGFAVVVCHECVVAPFCIRALENRRCTHTVRHGSDVACSIKLLNFWPVVGFIFTVRAVPQLPIPESLDGIVADSPMASLLACGFLESLQNSTLS